ncbi:MAG: hypothetical protein K0U93_02000 [Gammaproteobacteria bacterium]|nr:hypothetical protein [Gammaproteobacteria bacterium]
MADGHVFVGAAFWEKAKSGTATAGVFRLDPRAGTWASVSDGLPQDVEVRAFAVHPERASTIIAGTQVGPYQSDDSGATWRSLSLPDPDAVIWSIEYHPRDHRVIYAGAQDNAIYRSDDAGVSWRRLATPSAGGQVTMRFPTRVVRIAIDTQEPDTVYAGLEVAGVVKSTDGGETWSDCNGSLLTFTERDEYKSRIGSDTDTEGMMDSHAVLASPGVAGTVFLANRMGLFRSADAGATWSDLKVGRFSPITYARDVRVSPHNPKRLYGALSVAAASDEGALYQSLDNGGTWERFDAGVTIDSTLMSVATSYRTSDRVYAAARRGRIIGTEDNGASWREYQVPGNVQGVYAIACP